MINKNFDFNNVRQTDRQTDRQLKDIIDFEINSNWKKFDQNDTFVMLDQDNNIMIRQATKKGYITAPKKCVANLSHPNSETRRGRIIKNGLLTGTLTASPNLTVINYPYYRSLSALESLKLMGFSEDNYNKIKNVSSDQQIKKQSGNSIVVNVAEAILKELHKDTKEEIKYFELCAGIGAFSQAYKNNGYKSKLIGFSEVDKFAIKSFCAMHGKDGELNFGDMTQIKDLKNVDVLIGGTPCQDFSKEGKGQGGEKGSGTRSSLMHEQARIAIENSIPVVIWENVENAINGRHKESVGEYLSDLEKAGYNNHIKVLNAADFGIPQNRKRVFVVSIKN